MVFYYNKWISSAKHDGLYREDIVHRFTERTSFIDNGPNSYVKNKYKSIKGIANM